MVQLLLVVTCTPAERGVGGGEEDRITGKEEAVGRKKQDGTMVHMNQLKTPESLQDRYLHLTETIRVLTKDMQK